MMRKPFSVLFGLLLVLLGIVFLLDNFGYVDAGWVFENFWPLLLVVLGVAFLVRRPAWHRHEADGTVATSGPPAVESDYIAESDVFGDLRRSVTSRNFSGGNCSVVFGNIDIDLLQVELARGESPLHVSSVFGNVHLTLPAGLEYSVHASHVAGGVMIGGTRKGGFFQSVNYRSEGFTVAEKRLAILMSSVFGDITIQQEDHSQATSVYT